MTIKRRDIEMIRLAAAVTVAIVLALHPDEGLAQSSSPGSAFDAAAAANDVPAMLEAARALVHHAVGQQSPARETSLVEAAEALVRAGAADGDVIDVLRQVTSVPAGTGAPAELHEARRHALALEFEIAASRSHVDEALRVGDAFAAERGPDWHGYVPADLRRLAELHLSAGHPDRAVELSQRLLRVLPIQLDTARWLLGIIARLHDRRQLQMLQTTAARHPSRRWDRQHHAEGVLAAVELRLASLAMEQGDFSAARSGRETARELAARGSLPFAAIAEAFSMTDLAEYETLLTSAQASLSCDGHGRIAASDVDARESTLARATAIRVRITWLGDSGAARHAFLREEAVRIAWASALETAAHRCAIQADPRVLARIERMEHDADRLEVNDPRRADALRVEAAIERERMREGAAVVDPVAASFEERERARIRRLVAEGSDLTVGGPRDASASTAMTEYETRAVARWAELH